MLKSYFLLLAGAVALSMPCSAADFLTGQAARAVVGQPFFNAQTTGATNTVIGAAGGLAFANPCGFRFVTWMLGAFNRLSLPDIPCARSFSESNAEVRSGIRSPGSFERHRIATCNLTLDPYFAQHNSLL